MPIPVIIPDASSGANFPTGKTGSFAFSLSFKISSFKPSWTVNSAPPAGGTIRQTVLALSGDVLGVFRGITIQWSAFRPFGGALTDTISGFDGAYGSLGSGDVFYLNDEYNTPINQRYADITGTVNVTISNWEEWKTIASIPGPNENPDDLLQYLIRVPATATYTVDVNVSFPFLGPVDAAQNHKHYSGTIGSITGSGGYVDATEWKQSLLVMALNVPNALPGGVVQVTSLTFEDGHGTGFSYSTSGGGGALVLTDNSAVVSRSSDAGMAQTYFEFWPYTPVITDGQIHKACEGAFGSSVLLNTSIPSRAIVAAPGGVWSETVDCTKHFVQWNGVTVVDDPGTTLLQVDLDTTWCRGNGVDDIDQKCYLRDDVLWPATTFAHSASTTLESFAATTGWSGTGVTIT